MFFLDKLIFRRSEISNDAVLVVYKNEVGLLSEVLKLEITDGSREQWCSRIEEAKVRCYFRFLSSYLCEEID